MNWNVGCNHEQDISGELYVSKGLDKSDSDLAQPIMVTLIESKECNKLPAEEFFTPPAIAS